MIERIYTEPNLPKHGIVAQKIRALFQAYGTGYDFCKFYKQGRSVLAYLDGSLVLYADNRADYSELSDFIRLNGFTDFFCSAETANRLSNYLTADYNSVLGMKFTGEPRTANITETDALSEVFGILSTGFEIEFEPWYLDMSHRIRHGVSRAFLLDNTAALVVQHNINGEALLSQIAVVPSRRGQGCATKLIQAVCSELSPGECYVICERKMAEFYEKVGFRRTAEFCNGSP